MATTDNREIGQWLTCEYFTGREAASLIANYVPSEVSDVEIRPTLRKLQSSYIKAVEFFKQRLVNSNSDEIQPDALQSRSMQVRFNFSSKEFSAVKAQKWLDDNAENPDEWSVSKFDFQFFTRQELARWIKSTKTVSAFYFESNTTDKEAKKAVQLADRILTPNRTGLMDIVEEASAKFWGFQATPSDPSLHFTNAEIVEWLLSHRKVSKNVAESIATIIRPSWAPKGAKAGRNEK
jgi:hypothetical protein